MIRLKDMDQFTCNSCSLDFFIKKGILDYPSCPNCRSPFAVLEVEKLPKGFKVKGIEKWKTGG